MDKALSQPKSKEPLAWILPSSPENALLDRFP